jgi:hypothetical protein
MKPEVTGTVIFGKQSWANVTQNIIENRSYTYSYDNAKRLKSASFAGLPSEDYRLPIISFDRNGNILNLIRKGKNGNTFQNIDNLSYFYQGNKLTGVTDAVMFQICWYPIRFVNFTIII